MTDFTVSITDQAMLDGVTWATGRYNAEHLDAPLKEADYVAQVLNDATTSWGRAKIDGDLNDAIVAAKAGDATQLQAWADTMAKSASDIKPLPPQPAPPILVQP